MSCKVIFLFVYVQKCMITYVYSNYLEILYNIIIMFYVLEIIIIIMIDSVSVHFSAPAPITNDINNNNY